MVRKLFATSLVWLLWFISTTLRLIWMVVRPAVRFISAILMLAAVFTLVTDVSRWQVGDTQPWFHSVAHHINSASPTTFDTIAATVTNVLHPVLWDYGLLIVLSMPAWLIFTCISIVLAVAGRDQRRRIDIYAN